MATACKEATLGYQDVCLNVTATDCRDAIRKAAAPLIAQGNITSGYVQEMLDAFDTYGPYFVLAPGMAFAHAKPSPNVLKTGLSLITLKDAVTFGHAQNDPVFLVCVIASRDPAEHLEQLRKIVNFLGDEQLVKQLREASSEQDTHAIVDSINAR